MSKPIHDHAGKIVAHILDDAEYTRLLYDQAKYESTLREIEDAKKGIVRTWDGTNGLSTAEADRIS